LGQNPFCRRIEQQESAFQIGDDNPFGQAVNDVSEKG
jgi:hypothetical protein